MMSSIQVFAATARASPTGADGQHRDLHDRIGLDPIGFRATGMGVHRTLRPRAHGRRKLDQSPFTICKRPAIRRRYPVGRIGLPDVGMLFRKISAGTGHRFGYVSVLMLNGRQSTDWVSQTAPNRPDR